MKNFEKHGYKANNPEPFNFLEAVVLSIAAVVLIVEIVIIAVPPMVIINFVK